MRIGALLLIVAMCVGLIYTATPMNVEATGITTTADVVARVPNGDFESGTVGEVVPNWSKTAMTQTSEKETRETHITAYCNSFDLITQEGDNGSQVAAFTKKGAGYVAATSDRIAVLGGKDYTLSFDYKTASFTDAGTSTSATPAKYFVMYVEELDAEGNITAPISKTERKHQDDEYSNEWRTGNVAFQTQSDTATIVIYIVVILDKAYTATVHLDNVIVNMHKESGVLNGDFESGNVGAGVSEWSATAMDLRNTKITDEARATDFKSTYELTTASDGEDNQVAVLLKKAGDGYVGLTSQAIGVTGEKEYHLAFDYKTAAPTLQDATVTNSRMNAYYGVRLLVEELDANGNTIQVDGKDLTEYFRDENADPIDTWCAASVDVETQESTAYVILYLWFGGGFNRQATVYFDNVTLESEKLYSVSNATFDDVTYQADGGRADGEAGPAGWTMAGAANGGKLTGGVDSYKNCFKATVIEETGRGNVACLEYVSGTGYALLQSPYIAVDGEQTCTVGVDCKLIMNKADGTAALFSNGARNICLNLAYYDANKNFLGETTSSHGNTTNSEWKQLTSSAITTPTGTAYVKVGLFVALITGDLTKDTTLTEDDIAAMKAFKLYYDDVVLRVDGEITGWTAETCKQEGIPRDDADFRGNYDIRKESAGTGHEEALQLYVKREAGILGGVTFYSAPIPVTAGASYTTSFDLKVEGSDPSTTTNDYGPNGANVFGASCVLRYLDSEGNIINTTPTSLIGRKTENMDWTNYKIEKTVPSDAASVQIGLVIGGYQSGILPELTHTFDNIIFMESEVYENYIGK